MSDSKPSIASRGCCGGTAGSTFIEMAVALAFVGVVGAAGAPRIQTMLASYDLSNTTQRVVGDIRLARMRAVATNAQARLQFRDGAYVIQRESPPGSGSYVDDAAPQPLPATVQVSAAPMVPTFNSRGLAQLPATITLTAADGATRRISVNGIGRVTIN